MKVALDGRLCVGDYRGMGRFARKLMVPVQGQCLILGTHGQTDPELDVLDSGPALYPYWEQVHLPYLSWTYGVDIVVCPYNTAPLYMPSSIKTVLVIHDLIFMKSFKELAPSSSIYQVLGRLYRRVVTPRVVHKSDIVITVSNHSKKNIVEHFGVNEEVIHVIPNTVEKEWLQKPAEEFDYNKPYIFTLSGDSPSKNLERGVRAYARLVSTCSSITCDLLIAGVPKKSHKRFESIAQEYGIENKLRMLPYISNKKLRQVYNSAKLFFLPSLYEGFGIPIIEAMASRTPIVCSNNNCLQEVAGDSAVFVDPLRTDDMADGLYRLLVNKDLQNRLVKKGVNRVEKYHPNVVRKKVERFWVDVRRRL